MTKLNCWEFKKCGRHPGANSPESGPCPAAVYKDFDGVHDGKNAGRACWAVSASFCDGQQQGVPAQKLDRCRICDFFNMVKNEEENDQHGFCITPIVMRLYLRKRFQEKQVKPLETVNGGDSVGSDIINNLERRFLFMAGHPGKKIIDVVFIELRYKRGSNMTKTDFQYFVQYLSQSFDSERRQAFLETASVEAAR